MKCFVFAAVLAMALISPAGAYFQASKTGAEAGNANAQFDLGLFYETGTGVRRDNAKALLWYFRAARQGHQKAARALARFERRHPEIAKRVRTEERQRDELRRLEQER